MRGTRQRSRMGITSSQVRTASMRALKRHGCLNSMEVCRVVNRFEPGDFRGCYPTGDFAFKTRPERCEWKARNCDVWSLKVYNALRSMQKSGQIQSRKCRARDASKRNKSFQNTDIFRFWFTEPKHFEKRIVSQTLIPYLRKRGYKGILGSK